jgi:tetratricopeptide (TPR) repeat protein
MDNAWHRVGALAGVLIVVVATLLPVFDNGFVYDDTDVIEDGEVVHDVVNLFEVFRRPAMYVSSADGGPKAFDTYRPMTLISFFWDSAISGRDPFAYHLTNLLMHLLCVALVFLVVQRLVGREAWMFALVGAAWFALSPHPNTAQIWINGRSDLFCTAYGLASILVWRRALMAETPPKGAGLHVLAGLLFLAGLLSKETLLMVVPALWLWPRSDASVPLQERIINTSPILAASGLYLTLRVAVLGGVRASGGSGHIATALRHLAPVELEGLLGALWPRRLYLRFLSDEIGSLGATELTLLAILLIMTLGALWRLRRNAPIVSWGLCWFGLCLAPAALIAGMLWPGFGRYLYLPSVGLAAALASGTRAAWTRFPRWRAAVAVVAVVYLGVLGVNLRGWAKDFHDVETLYGATITKNPKGPHAYGWLGIAYRKQGRNDESIAPLTIAHQLAPNTPRYTHHLLYSLVETGRGDAAIELAKDCVRQHESDAEECHLLLYSTYQMTDPELAIGHLLDCMNNERNGARCNAAFAHAITKHPLHARYREIASQRSRR